MSKKTKIKEKNEGLLNWSDMRQTSGMIIYWIMYVFLLILSLICLLPVLWMFISGFKTTQELYAIPPKLLPSSIDLGLVKDIYKTAHIGRYAFNSLCIIVGCLGFDLVFNGIAGYVLSRIKPKGSDLLNTLLFWTMMLPGISMVPLYMTFVDMPIFHVNETASAEAFFVTVAYYSQDNRLIKHEIIEASGPAGASNTVINIPYTVSVPENAQRLKIMTWQPFTRNKPMGDGLSII